MQNQAASAFRCPLKFATKFERPDPFNEENLVAGWICRKKGLMGGALFITHVNGKETPPQLVYGTPKLAYPYKPDSVEYLPLKADSYYLAEKWNGVNVLFFMYRNSDGKSFSSAKTKGSAFLSDSEFGPFLTLTQEALSDMKISCKVYSALGTKGAVAASFELCGRKEPHLVAYDFDLDLKPLFTIHEHGKIRPIITNRNNLTTGASGEDIVSDCQWHQANDQELNEEFQKQHNLNAKYEFEHFLTEGKVLYLLSQENFALGRILYKIKPQAIEECHWSRFDESWKNRVREGLRKLGFYGAGLTTDSLKEELDMGPKEWGKFGASIIKFAEDEGFVLRE